MTDGSSGLRRRGSRIYRSLPPAAQHRLAPAIAQARARLRDASAARPTLPLPMGEQIPRLEREALDDLIDVLDVAGLRYFLIPVSEPGNLRLGMAEEDRGALARALSDCGSSLVISWTRGRRFLTASGADVQQMPAHQPETIWVHREVRAVSAADAQDAARAIEVEFWRPDGQGAHQAALPNVYASVVRMDSPLVSRRARTGRAVPTFEAFATPDVGEVAFPVDAVYLWVDDSDPVWRSRRDAYMGTTALEGFGDSTSDARFRQHDELRYSLRSLSMFAPWIRHVFLVTDDQRPNWLAIDCPRVTVVDHKELFRGLGRLPTYNSHALAARLHHIEGLAEQFVYMNDDVFFGSRTGAELWFDGSGRPRFHFTGTTTLARGAGDLTSVEKARNHTSDLAFSLTGRLRRRNLQHGPIALTRSLLSGLESELPDHFARTWDSQVRHEDDLVPERLAAQVGLARGMAIDGGGVRYCYFNVGLPDTRDRLRSALLSPPAHTFCLNDGEGSVAPQARHDTLTWFMREYFPVASEFEVDEAGLSAAARRR